MKKKSIQQLYAVIFVLAVVLYAFSLWKYMIGVSDWFVYTLSLAIMFLSLWGYLMVKKL